MTKADVLAKIEEFKDRPIVLGLADEGVVLYGNIEGHWLFNDGDKMIEVRLNTSTANSLYGVNTINQNQNPFIITVINFDTINYVRSFIKNDAGDIDTIIKSSFTPVGTSKALDDIKKELQSNSIRNSKTPSGNLNTPNVAYGTDYGTFKGSILSTEKDGLPKYVKDSLL